MFKHISSDIFNSLTQGELTVLRYIDTHKQDVTQMSIQELSAVNYTSTATVLRLCKKLRLDGFSELKYLLKTILRQETAPEKSREDEALLLQNQLQIMENTGRLMDVQALEFICDWFLSEKKVHLYAGGLSTAVMEYMQRFLLSTGRSCFFYATAPLGYRAADKMTEKDLLIILSASGSTPSVVRIAQIAKNSGAVVASITALNGNPLSQLADLRFFTFIGNRDYYGTDIKSRSPLFYVVSTILECYLFRLEQNRQAYQIQKEGGSNHD